MRSDADWPWTSVESLVGKSAEFPTFVDEPPIISIKGGVVLVSYQSSKGRPERAMSVKTLQKAVERAQRALRQHAAGDDTVIIDD